MNRSVLSRHMSYKIRRLYTCIDVNMCICSILYSEKLNWYITWAYISTDIPPDHNSKLHKGRKYFEIKAIQNTSGCANACTSLCTNGQIYFYSNYHAWYMSNRQNLGDICVILYDLDLLALLCFEYYLIYYTYNLPW